VSSSSMLERFARNHASVINVLFGETYCRTVCRPRLNVSKDFGEVGKMLTLLLP
jgi:hypothetical protein